MEADASSEDWSFESAIRLLKLSTVDYTQSAITAIPFLPTPPPSSLSEDDIVEGGLGDFSEVWKALGVPQPIRSKKRQIDILNEPKPLSPESEFAQLVKAVKWRDEYDGADLEDNVEPQQITTSNLRTRKRAARRAKARQRELQETRQSGNVLSDTATDGESGEELESLRRSPDRRAVIADLLGRPRPTEISPPTSPSPPKENSLPRTSTKTSVKKEWPVANPFLWTAPGAPSQSPMKVTILPEDGHTPEQRKISLIGKLSQRFSDEQKYLRNSGLLQPAFNMLNTSPIGVHVFIDMSNISIGFHDCLKVTRGIPISTRVRRIPLSFHNLSLVLERGRPAAKRILCGSDRSPATDQAEACGYEVNILDRVHKVKTPTTKIRKHTPSRNGGDYNSASGYGETSGSETPGYISTPAATYKWSEQAVDEILHLKMSHSILDAEKPSTIILATGDAAEAEYSDGFLRMVERALNKGWMVELVSFKLNTSSLYRRTEFRTKWKGMFKWIPLDEYAEALIDEGL